MERNKLDCCVVRDLLPAYIEELTERETSELVREHLEHCPDCTAMEKDMRAQIPVEKAPKGALNFLKRVRRTRLLAAVLTVIVTLCAVWGLYDLEYHWSNDPASLAQAAQEYLINPPNSSIPMFPQDTEFRVIASAERDGHLFVYVGGESQSLRGFMHLERGWNGKYQTVNATLYNRPGGVYVRNMWVQGGEPEYQLMLVGEDCREIYSAVVEYTVKDNDSSQLQYVHRTYEIGGGDFLRLLDAETEAQYDAERQYLWSEDVVQLLDRDGNDITDQYQLSANQSGMPSKSTAERFLLYWYIGIAGLIGAAFVRYFLRRD